MAIRYSAIVKDGTWTEVGDRIACRYHHGSTHTSLKPPTMRIEDFPKEFDKRLRAKRLALNVLPIVDAVNLMMAFYREVPVTGISPPPDDSLKFAWGVRYRGEGDHFEINLSRVATTRRVDAPPIVREFELTYRLTPTTDLRSIPANEIWAYKRVELPDLLRIAR